MSILTVGSSLGRGRESQTSRLPKSSLEAHGLLVTGFQPPAAYLEDKQMLRILGRGHSVPTVTELIFVREQCLTILLFKHFALCGTITGSSKMVKHYALTVVPINSPIKMHW
jgi:hypothetical protein